MSADNWARCPRCAARALKAKRAAEKKANDAYGKVSLGDYLRLRDAAERQPDDAGESLREDYSIYLNVDGSFRISYHAVCQDCGFEHSFKHEQQITIPE